MDKLKLPTVQLPKHQARLHRFLEERTPKPMSFIYRLVPTAVVCALLLALGAHLLPKQSVIDAPVASAQDLVEEAYERTRSLTADERAAIEAQIEADLDGTLKEAYEAEDLRIVEMNSDVIDVSSDEQTVTIHFPEAMDSDQKAGYATFEFTSPGPENPEEAVYLMYTNKNEESALLGLNSEMLPFLLMTYAEDTLTLTNPTE